MRKKLIAVAAVVVIIGGALFIPVGGEARSKTKGPVASMDLSSFSADPPSTSLRLLFIHHSVGGQLLANPGDNKDIADSIHVSHENGGGLRKLLQNNGYEVHEASYGSELGENTDLFDWLPKFQHHMDKVLTCNLNDEYATDGARNRIVLFKSCYPNSRFVGEGSAPGDPAGPELTVENAKATLTALLPELGKQPDTLFVYLTAPPNAPKYPAEPAWKWLAKKALGKPDAARVLADRAALAREFNNWVRSPDGWLKDYPHNNVVVFDYYDALTDGGASNLSQYPSGDGSDSHPSSEGQKRVAAALLPFLNRAVRRAGLSD